MMTPNIPHRIETIRAHKEHGGRIGAILPIHYPRALFRAFDILPVEVWGPPHIDCSLGSAHLQPYVCSIVRNSLAYLLSGGLDLTDLIVVPHACDSLQGFASILIDFIKPTLHPERSAAESKDSLATIKPIVPIYLPRGNRDSDLQFLADEFRSIYRTLAEITQRNPSDAELISCNAREEHADDLLANLHRNRMNIALSQSDLYRLIRSREYLPAEKFIEIVGAMLAVARPGQPRGLPPQNISIILSGIVPEPMTLFNALDTMNAFVVADDLACCGRRLYPHGASNDPFTRMAERILTAPPDSTRGSPIEERIKHLETLAKTTGAKGVVFYDVKFCEPELFYHPTLRKALSECGIPSVVIEFDLNDPFSQQTQTRLEAFLEMIAPIPSPS